MFIYAIGTDTKQKIGVSGNPENRLLSLQTANSEELTIHYTFEVPDKIAYQFEKHIHREQNHKRILGEWFTMSISEVAGLLAFYDMTQDTIALRL